MMFRAGKYRGSVVRRLVLLALLAFVLRAIGQAQGVDAPSQESIASAKSTVAVVGNVTMVEASYLPARAAFVLDAGAPA